MTYIELKKKLLDIDMTLPEFCDLIKISDKNLRSYKKKGEVPNAIAVVITCFAEMERSGVDFSTLVKELKLKKKTKKGGFSKKPQSARK